VREVTVTIILEEGSNALASKLARETLADLIRSHLRAASGGHPPLNVFVGDTTQGHESRKNEGAAALCNVCSQ